MTEGKPSIWRSEDEFKDTEIGRIPKEWEVRRIEEISEKLTDGKHGNCTNLSDSGFYFISCKDIYDGKINYENARQITEDDYHEVNKRVQLHSGDVLITNSGTIGKMAITRNDHLTSKTTFQKSVAIIKPLQRDIKSEFMYYSLLSEKRRLIEFAGGTTQKNLLLRDIRQFMIPLPSLPEQKAIAHILSTLDEKIELNRKMNKTLEEIGKAIFKHWFVDFEFPDEEGKPYKSSGGEMVFNEELEKEIPEGWEVKSINEIAHVAIGKTPPRKEKRWFSKNPQNIPWISIKDMGLSGTYIFNTSEYITAGAVKKFNIRTIPENTVICSFKLTIGRISITSRNMISNEAIAHFILNKYSILVPEYLYLYLKDFNFSSLGSTSSIATAVNSKIMKTIPIIIPSERLINQLFKNIESIFGQMKMNQSNNDILIKLRNSLLPKLISGKIKVDSLMEGENEIVG